MIKGHVILVDKWIYFWHEWVRVFCRTNVKCRGVCLQCFEKHSNPPLALCNVCSRIYGCRLDQQQIKADTVSSGLALAGLTPTPSDCWSMAVTLTAPAHVAGGHTWSSEWATVILTATNGRGMSLSRFLVKGSLPATDATVVLCLHLSWGEYRPDTWKEQEVPLCRRTPDLSNQLAALPSHKSLRLCLKAVHLLLRGCRWMCLCTGLHLSERPCLSGVGGRSKNMWFVVLRLLIPCCSQRCSSLTLSVVMKPIFKAKRGGIQMWQDAWCV